MSTLTGTVRLNHTGTPRIVEPLWSQRYLLPDVGKAYFGYYKQDPSTISIQETQYGRNFDLTIVYGPTQLMQDATYLTPLLASHLAAGRMPRLDLTWGTIPKGETSRVPTFWSDVAAGRYDDPGTYGSGTPYVGITANMREITQQLGQRIFVSLWHEMDAISDGGGYQGVWYGTAADFRAAWQHVVTLTRNLVANEGGFEPVWFFDPAYDPNDSFGGGAHKWGSTLTDSGSNGVYPGHSYVDWVGSDPYNYAAVSTHGYRWDSPLALWNNYGGANWWDLHFKIGGKRTQAEVVGSEGVYKPAMWGETGTNERWVGPPYTGGTTDAAQWMADLLTLMAPGGGAAGKLMGVTWFGVDYWNHSSYQPMSGADLDLLNDADSAQRWPMLAVLGASNVFKVR